MGEVALGSVACDILVYSPLLLTSKMDVFLGILCCVNGCILVSVLHAILVACEDVRNKLVVVSATLGLVLPDSLP